MAPKQKPLPLPPQSVPREPVYKVWPPKIENLGALDLVGLEKGRVQCAIASAAAQLKIDIARLTEEAAARLFVDLGGEQGPLAFADWVAALDAEAEKFCSKNRDSILEEGRKSRDLNHCRVGWRDLPAALEPLPDFDESGNDKHLKDVRAWLREQMNEKYELGSLIELKLSWRKKEMLKAFEDRDVSLSKLKKAGYTVREEKENFYLDPSTETLQSQSAEKPK